jgi:phage baseplate assembly protein W
MAYIIQVNPIDLEKNVALGIDLPMNAANGSKFQTNYTSKEQAVANAKNLLLTEPGERIMLPDFGCGLKRALFEQQTPEGVAALERRIRLSFKTYLPYIVIQNLIFTPNEEQKSLAIKLDISLDPEGIDTQSILVEVNGQI